MHILLQFIHMTNYVNQIILFEKQFIALSRLCIFITNPIQPPDTTEQFAC